MRHMKALLRCTQRKIKRTGMDMDRRRYLLLGAFFVALSIRLAAQPPLAIVDEPLPPIEAGIEFHLLLHATGGVPPYIWTSDDVLPDGISLTPRGLLSGRPAKAGPISLSFTVTDSAHPANLMHKVLNTAVTASLVLEWQDPPKVAGDRIDGAVQVSNGSKDTYDLTFYVVAIAENGRATAIGYQRFPLKPQTSNFKIPFGNTLPPGGYVIHADAIAEIPKRQTILRQSLQTPSPLAIVQEP
jgi:hypothetical protein